METSTQDDSSRSVDAPAISIICTCYNKAPWIRRAAESILAQVLEESFELILVDDASTDGSADVIRSIETEHPGKVRAVYHGENLGIGQTWVQTCKLARGAYIARCDGDDYWTTPDKLAKQLAALRVAGAGSGWCSTDFDMADVDEHVLAASCFENGTIPLADTYEKMLATKGFTMSSTWLVETQLMLDANESIDSNASDDTFEIQLELFKRTRLTYLPVSTTAYRINHGSDSRPQDLEGAHKRYMGLLASQLRYLDSYEGIDLHELAKIFFAYDEKRDEQLAGYDAAVRQLRDESSAAQSGLADVRAQLATVQADLEAAQGERDALRKELNGIKTSKRWTMANRLAHLAGR